MVVGQRALARLRLADGDPGRVAERTQRFGRLGVDDAAARDDERPLGAANELGRQRERRASGTARGTVQARSARNSSGQSNASAWTSCGKASVTAPVSAGLVSTRIAASAAGITCSGREIRSK